MGFGDLKSKAGLEALNAFLAERSYIEGFEPSQADVVVFKVLSGAPAADLYHALRWYNHINSFGDSKNSFHGVAKSVDSYGPPGATPAPKKENDEDDFDDLFGDSESEDEETKKRLADYAAKKSKKPVIIAKSNIILDVKPWDDETDMKLVEEKVRSIQADGLLWGTSKLVPVGYGIKKLQISCVVEDDKIGTDFLDEEITKFEDLVQSVDVAAFNKI